jgi:uncharacterized protein
MTDFAPDQLVFINLPVADLARSRAFYAALGFGFDERFCTEQSLMVGISPAIHLMLLTPEHFASFSPRPVAPAGTVGALIALSRNSAADVDGFVEAAVAGGGTDNDKVQSQGDFMYGRSVSDPDGHVIEVMWMDLEAAMRAWSAAA